MDFLVACCLPASSSFLLISCLVFFPQRDDERKDRKTGREVQQSSPAQLPPCWFNFLFLPAGRPMSAEQMLHLLS